MESPRLRLLPLLGAALLLLLPLLGTLAQEGAELQPRALDIYSAVEDASHEKELVCIPPAPDSPGLPRGSFLCARPSSLSASPPPFLSQGPGRWAQIPGSRCYPKNVLSPRAPDSL